jgi:hypothetical protein
MQRPAQGTKRSAGVSVKFRGVVQSAGASIRSILQKKKRPKSQADDRWKYRVVGWITSDYGSSLTTVITDTRRRFTYLLLWLAFVSSSQGATFPASEDTWSNRGKLTLTAHRATTLRADANRRAFVFFDLTELPAGARIRYARLRLFFPAVTRPGSGLTVHKVTGQWNESAASEEPTFEASPLGQFGPAAVGNKRFVSLDVTGTVKSWIADPVSNEGFVIAAVAAGTPNQTASVTIGAKEGTGNGYPAELEVELEADQIHSDQLASDLSLSGTTTGAFSGTFTGDGAALTGLNAGSLGSGTVSTARLPGELPVLANVSTSAAGRNLLGYSPVQTSWVGWIRADDVTGADGNGLVSVAPTVANGIVTFAGSTTLRSGANGINGHKALEFNGATDQLTSQTGGSLFAGNFYVAAVVQWSNLAGFQELVFWGDNSFSKLRTLFKDVSGNRLGYSGFNNDIVGAGTSVGAGKPYFVEMSNFNGMLRIWINGTLIGSGNPQFGSYSSNVLSLGVGPAGNSFHGLMAECFLLNADVSEDVRKGLRNYVADRYAVPMADYGTSAQVYTGGTTLGFTASAALPVQGSVAAFAVTAEHLLSNYWDFQNTLAIWNQSGSGLSAIRFCRTDAIGGEMGAIGWGRDIEPLCANGIGSNYWEFSDFNGTNTFGIGRICQTKADLGQTLRTEWKSNGDIVFYNQKLYTDNAWASILTLFSTKGVAIGGAVDPGPGNLLVSGNTLRVATPKTPTGSSAPGNPGDICWDSDYLYVCVSVNTWKRSALSSW